jgi:hypothetical protein
MNTRRRKVVDDSLAFQGSDRIEKAGVYRRVIIRIRCEDGITLLNGLPSRTARIFPRLG